MDAQIAKEIAEAYPSIAGQVTQIVAALHELGPADFYFAPLPGHQTELANIRAALQRQGLPDLTAYLDQPDWDRFAEWCQRLRASGRVLVPYEPTGFGSNGNGHHPESGTNP